ncbi:MAG TPA: cyclic nucleotide-binding domain-containing protein, partial [Trueperaceae bacterium]|nr:cyclic nucleotide-binding domain-containing protein [Trueperaceae bacterium]
VGGLLAYFGLRFLYQWLYEALFELPLGDYLIVGAILAVIVVAGVLPGVGVGLVLTVALFVISSSRTDAVRYAVGGADLRSRVTRGAAELARLAEHGGEIMVVQLQGFLFFGTATALLERLERRVSAGPPVRSVILDFSRVSGVDATGLATIADAFRLGEASGFELLLSGVPDRIYRRLGRSRKGGRDAVVEERFAKLDAALEHAEERLLERWDARRDVRGTEVDAVAHYSGTGFDFADLLPYLTRRELRAGEVLIRKGDKADELYFLVDGQMTAVAEGSDGAATRLETLRSGGLLGELGFYRGGVRSATVRADHDSKLLVLDERGLTRLTAEAPQLAADLHRQVARLMAGRVLHLMAAVDALER